MQKTIEKIIRIGKIYICDSFNLYRKRDLIFVISGRNISTALNRKKNESQKVNVLNWYDEFWLYIEISFAPLRSKKSKKFPNVLFSLSVFQGKENDDIKSPLLRAEWDNYEDLSENHPQPHWHIYINRDVKDFSKNFEEMLTSSGEDFETYIQGEERIIDLGKFHFAMNGKWSEKETAVHRIECESHLTDWFEGVIRHIRTELDYIR